MFGDFFDKSKKEERALKKERRKKDKLWQKKLARDLSYADCASTLEICGTEFDTIIKLERMRYQERLDKGLDFKNQKERMINAAKGRRIVDQAKAELEDNRYTEDLNSSINYLCLALKQLNRVSDSTPYISKQFFKRTKGLFDSEQDYIAELNELEVPEDVDSLVRGSFVENLLAGDNYDTCLRKSIQGSKRVKSLEAEKYGAMLDEIRDSGVSKAEDITDEDLKAAKKMLDF